MIVRFMRLNILLSGIIGITANIVVLAICCTTKLNIYKELEFIIIFQTFHALLTIIVNSVSQLAYCVEGGNVTIAVLGPLAQHLPTVFIAWFLYMFHFLLAVGVLTFHVGFGFQYTKICRKHLFGIRYEEQNIPLLYAVLCILALIIEIINAPTMQVVYTGKCFRDYMNETFQLKREKKDTWRLSFFVFSLVIAAFCSLIIIIFTTMKTLQSLRVQNFHQKTSSLLKKFTIMMLLQAILPMIAVIMPFLIYAWTLLIPMEIGNYGALVFAFFYWQPCIHSLITLFFLKPFYMLLSIKDFLRHLGIYESSNLGG